MIWLLVAALAFGVALVGALVALCAWPAHPDGPVECHGVDDCKCGRFRP